MKWFIVGAAGEEYHGGLGRKGGRVEKEGERREGGGRGRREEGGGRREERGGRGEGGGGERREERGGRGEKEVEAWDKKIGQKYPAQRLTLTWCLSILRNKC